MPLYTIRGTVNLSPCLHKPRALAPHNKEYFMTTVSTPKPTTSLLKSNSDRAIHLSITIYPQWDKVILKDRDTQSAVDLQLHELEAALQLTVTRDYAKLVERIQARSAKNEHISKEAERAYINQAMQRFFESGGKITTLAPLKTSVNTDNIELDSLDLDFSKLAM
jgi:hypothetical protein